jgi:pimeloyl-ACP methyl ester carboxylesterase
VLDAVAGAGGPPRSVIIGQSIGAAATLRAALSRSDRVAGAVLAHSLGGMRHDELTALVRADRAAAEKLPALDRLLTPEFRQRRPDLAFLFRQMGMFNTATMQSRSSRG